MASGKHVLFMYSEICQRYVFLLTEALAAMTAYTELAVNAAYLPSTNAFLRLTVNYPVPRTATQLMQCKFPLFIKKNDVFKMCRLFFSVKDASGFSKMEKTSHL